MVYMYAYINWTRIVDVLQSTFLSLDQFLFTNSWSKYMLSFIDTLAYINMFGMCACTGACKPKTIVVMLIIIFEFSNAVNVRCYFRRSHAKNVHALYNLQLKYLIKENDTLVRLWSLHSLFVLSVPFAMTIYTMLYTKKDVRSAYNATVHSRMHNSNILFCISLFLEFFAWVWFPSPKDGNVNIKQFGFEGLPN